MLSRASLAVAPALETMQPSAWIAPARIAPAWTRPDWVAPDWIAIGLVLSILGAFLLGNAILFRHPRTLVGEFFGSRTGARGVRLHAIREYVFHRAQVAVGFTYLVGGFGLELLGRYRPFPSGPFPPEAGAPTVQPAFPAAWVGAILVLTIALLALAWWWARHSFRRHVRGHLRREPPDFESDLRLAREVGDLFGVEAQDDDTVQSYLERLHRAIDLPPPVPRGRREIPLPRMEELEAEENA